MAKKEKKPHLGRGLESLLGPFNQTSPVSDGDKINVEKTLPPDMELRNSIRMISIREIKPNPFQPRTNWNQEDLDDLTESIRTNGILQPILLRNTGIGFEVIAGERRLRAAQQAGLEEVPALVRKASDDEMLELALVENIHRADLNAIERALAYKNFIDSFSLSQTEAAQRLGQDRSVISNYLRLLDLPQEVKQMLINNSLSMGHARAILALPTDELRRKLANRAMAGRLSVREVEKLVRKYIQGQKETEKEVKEKEPNIIDLENRLRAILGTKVTIEQRKRGNRGKIILEYYSLDEFERLTEKMGLKEAEII